MSRIATLMALILSLAATAAYPSNYRIILPPEPAQVVRHAASELSSYLREMTGATVKISEDASGADPAFILDSKGSNPAAKALVDSRRLVEPAEWAAETNPEAYYLKSAGTNVVVLAGKSDVAVLYAVYDYLQRYGKCGFYEDGEYVPRKAPPMKAVSYFTKPRMSNREFHGDLCGAFGIKKFHFGHRTKEDWVKFYDWMAKRRMNMSGIFAGINSLWSGEAVEMAFGVKVDETPGEQYGAGWPTGWTWPSKERTRLMRERLAYSRSIGIKAFYFCMYGHCPIVFKKQHPELKWVPSNYDHALLHPDEPLASELTAKFYKAVIDLYGTDHYYTDTPYCESMGAGNEDESLKLKIIAGKKACDVFKQVDPKSVWVWDSWDFGAQPWLWTSERRQKFFDSIPRDMTFCLDAATDFNPQYESSNYFHGLPWAVGVIHSYQGGDHLHGNLLGLINTMNKAIGSPGGEKLDGYFNLPELHAANIMFWQLSTLLSWDPRGVKLEDYLDEFALTRYGEESYPAMRKAVDAVARGVYSGQDYEPIYQVIGGGWTWQYPIFEDNYQVGSAALPQLAKTTAELREAVRLALTQEKTQQGNQLYENDMLDWTKSYLTHMFNYCAIRAGREFRAGNAAETRKWSKAGTDLLEQIEMILSTRPDHSIINTIKDAMKVPGTNPATEAMIRQQCVNDLYATNDVYEQMHHFYRPKIDAYFKELNDRLARGEKAIAIKDMGDHFNKIAQHWHKDPLEVPESEKFKGTTMQAIRAAVKVANRIDSALDESRNPKDLKRLISVVCGAVIVDDGLSVVPNPDGPGKVSDFEGAKCWAFGPESPDKQPYVYFSADDMLVSENKAPLTITFEYYDGGTGEAVLEYDSHDPSATLSGAYKGLVAFTPAGTNQWKEAVVKLPDPRFINRQNTGADFRIATLQGVIRIRKVTVSP